MKEIAADTASPQAPVIYKVVEHSLSPSPLTLNDSSLYGIPYQISISIYPICENVNKTGGGRIEGA